MSIVSSRRSSFSVASSLTQCSSGYGEGGNDGDGNSSLRSLSSNASTITRQKQQHQQQRKRKPRLSSSSNKKKNSSNDATHEIFIDFTMNDHIAEYWMREFAKKQYLAKCSAVGVEADYEYSPRQVLRNTEIMVDTWFYWREEPNCIGVDFWVGTKDREVHAYPRFVMVSHLGSHPQTR